MPFRCRSTRTRLPSCTSLPIPTSSSHSNCCFTPHKRERSRRKSSSMRAISTSEACSFTLALSATKAAGRIQMPYAVKYGLSLLLSALASPATFSVASSATSTRSTSHSHSLACSSRLEGASCQPATRSGTDRPEAMSCSPGGLKLRMTS